MKTITSLFVFIFALFATASLSAQERPIQSFRVGPRVPFAAEGQRALSPALGLGIEVRLEALSRTLPFGGAFVCTYDEFVERFPDRTLVLSDGTVLSLPQTQSYSYSGFFVLGSTQLSAERLRFHADGGAGVLVGFFHAPQTERDEEVFVKELMPAVSGSAGLGVTLGQRGVIDLTARYQVPVLSKALVAREGVQHEVFHELFSMVFGVGYLF